MPETGSWKLKEPSDVEALDDEERREEEEEDEEGDETQVQRYVPSVELSGERRTVPLTNARTSDGGVVGLFRFR